MTHDEFLRAIFGPEPGWVIQSSRVDGTVVYLAQETPIPSMWTPRQDRAIVYATIAEADEVIDRLDSLRGRRACPVRSVPCP